MDDKKHELELRAAELEKTRERAVELKKALERAKEKQDVNTLLSIVDDICSFVSPKNTGE